MMSERGKRQLWVALAGLAVALMVGGVATARIVPQKSIAKIKLGMTKAEVKAVKGKPDGQRIVPNEILGEQRKMRYGKTRVFFSGVRPRSEVISVLTRSRKQRTRKGVGVGSSEQDVKQKVAGAKCSSEFGTRSCVKGEFEPGERVTIFKISKRERVVKRVTVAIVID